MTNPDPPDRSPQEWLRYWQELGETRKSWTVFGWLSALTIIGLVIVSALGLLQLIFG